MSQAVARRSLWRSASIVRFAFASLALLAGVSAASAEQHTFTFKPPGADKPTSVAVAGDFNGWNTTATPMTEKDGAYVATVDLTPGLHTYKFVLSGNDWVQDPAADTKLDQPDGQGGNNSAVMIGNAPATPPPAAATPPAAGATAAGDHTFTFTPPAGQKPTSVNLVGDFNSWNTSATVMTEKDGSYSATVKLTPGLHAYKFLLSGTDWVQDPSADTKLDQPDGQGGNNSAIMIGDAGGAAPPAAPAAGATDAGSHTFTFTPPAGQPKPTSVNLAGDFNGWNTSATPMTEKDGAFVATVKLTPGAHAYKFILNGSDWVQDPTADTKLDQPDGQGGNNSGVMIGGGSPATPGGPPAPPAPDKRTSLDNGDVQYQHEFYFVPEAGKSMPQKLYVVGDFNGWDDSATRMVFADGAFRASVALPEGVHLYKFKKDGEWINDPRDEKELEADDGYGGKNSAFLAGPDGRNLPPAQPDAINRVALVHTPRDFKDCNVTDQSHVRLSMMCQADDVQSVVAVIGSSGGPTTRVPLIKISTTAGLDRYAAVITVPTPGQPVNYFFELTDGSAKAFLSASDEARTQEQAGATAFTANMQPAFQTPDWAKHAVWYQIFPERFRNGDASNDPGDTADTRMIRWTSRWDDLQPGETPGAENVYDGAGNVWKRRYGGDIQGIQQELPYLKSLGITSIYLNPIFEAESMHKYDTTDYRHVDNHFGVKGDWPVAGETEDPATWKWSASDKVFLDFVADAHKQGFKIVLDGVFNHVGRPCPFFQDVLANGKNSKYADWFEITDWGDEANWHPMTDPYAVHGKPGGIQWNAWDGKNGHLPNWKKNSTTGIVHGPLELINNITKRWLAPDGDPSRGVDGFRLDAAEQIPHAFWKQWRDVVKQAKPDAYITGEIWNSAQPWINDGKQFDAVMNYQFAMPTIKFFANNKQIVTPSQFGQQLMDVAYRYPFQSSLAMMNLFDSHDTDRFASMFVNPDRNYDSGNRLQDPDAKNYSVRKPNEVERKRQMQTVALQMSFVGCPMIYYGDENGMWSADDPSDRQPMVWKDLGAYDDPEVKFDDSLFDWYRRCIAVRQARPELQIGFEHTVLADDADNVFAFERDLDSHHSCVVVNRSDSPQDITVNFGPADRDVPLASWLDGAMVTPPGNAPDARPQISENGAAKVPAHNGKAHVALPAWGSAILSGDWN